MIDKDCASSQRVVPFDTLSPSIKSNQIRFGILSQRSAFYFVMTAWLVGTLLFEIASGGSPALLPRVQSDAVAGTQNTFIEEQSSIDKMVPDSLRVDPVISTMPFSTWVTRMAYQRLDRQYQIVGLHRMTKKRLSLDMARQSGIPGLMRIVVCPDERQIRLAQQSASRHESGVRQASATLPKK